jgi:hypothetical protein
MSTKHQDVICNLAMPDLSRYCQTVPTELPSLPLDHRRKLPNIPAVYFALGEGNEVLYIGKSVSLLNRWWGKSHHRFAQLESLGSVRLAWIELESKEFLDEVEQVLIEYFSPAMNGWRERTNNRERTDRNAQIIVRLAPEEKESFERAAEIAGQNLSDWVRTRLRQIAVNELSSAGETPLFMPPTKVQRRKI